MLKSCFILRNVHGSTLYLTPFQIAAGSGSWDPDEEIRWYSCSSLSAHEKDSALLTLYSQIDRGVDRWIQDKRYIPRLLLGAIAFLVTYFFFSLAVRDPIPMVDELILASLASFLVAMYLIRRDKKSALAMKRRMELKQNASRGSFELLDGLACYEEYLVDCAALDPIDLADRLAKTGGQELPRLEIPTQNKGPWQADLALLLLDHVKLNEPHLQKRLRQVLDVQDNKTGDEALSARLLSLAMNGSLDLSMLALLVRISK